MNCGHALMLACPSCQTELPPDARFCMNCGHQMKAGAPPAEPRTSPPPSRIEPQHIDPAPSPLSRFIPREFAAKLESARSNRAMEGERRVVTMLFCDVKGSTSAASQLDPEEWAEIMNGAYEYMIAPIYRYEGTVARLMGDSILAFFGAPIAHEDDPQRAILAGLDIVRDIRTFRQQMRSQWGLDIDVRVGINTGLVVVGAVGSDLRMEYTAMGDAINLAARMEQTARPGTVQIGEDTYKLIAPLFECESLGEIEIKGKLEPVVAYRVIGEKKRPGRLRGVDGLDSPLVGRDQEMHQLQGALLQLRQGTGQIVSLIGEAGLGKSRLIADLRQLSIPITEEAAKLRWLEGRSLSYQTAVPYAPFIDLFTNHFALQVEEADAEKYERVVRTVAEFMPQSAHEISPYLGSLLGLKLTGEALDRVKFMDPPLLRGRVFEAVLTYIQQLASECPLVLIFDDVHWIDPTSLDLLQQMLPLADGHMLLLVAMFRPPRDEKSAQFHQIAEQQFADKYRAITLKPLDEAESRELVANLLHVEGLPIKARQLILDKSEGNPFFVEEVIRSMLDAGLVVKDGEIWRATQDIDRLEVPNTLAGVINARMDRLDSSAYDVAQKASVIGREFTFDTLAGLMDNQDYLEGALFALQQREWIREKSRFPNRTYIFKHVLSQETAYASLLLKKRRILHRQVADLLELRSPDQAGDIGRHLLEAREGARALPYLVEAGARAARSYATSEAIRYYQQAIQFLDDNTDLALARLAYEGFANVLTFANELLRAVEIYQTMLELGESRGDIPMQVSALNKLSFLHAMRLGKFQEAEELITEAERRARLKEDAQGLSELSLIRCMMCTAVADFDGVVRYMDETVDIGRQLAVKEQMSMGLEHIAVSQTYMMQFDQAWEKIEEGLRLSREIGDRIHEVAFLTHPIPLRYLRDGDLDAAQSAAEEGLQIAINIGSPQSEAVALELLGTVAYRRGSFEQAIDYYQRCLAACRVSGFVWVEVLITSLLGSVYLDMSGKFTKTVRSLHDEALNKLEQPAGNMMGASVWAELGFCLWSSGDLEAAEELFQKGLDQPTIPGQLERARLLVGSAEVALSRYNIDQALQLVADARNHVETHALQHQYPLVAYTEGRIHAALGNTEQAVKRFSSSEEYARKMSMRPAVWKAAAGAAQALYDVGRLDEAEEKQTQAARMIEQIVQMFADKQLGAEYARQAAGHIRFDAGASSKEMQRE